MITVAIVDDHQAVRLGLRTALLSEPGLEPVGSAADAGEAAVLMYRTRPDVVLLDYRLPDTDGLTLCRRLKSDVPAPAVVLYSAFADPSMTVPAIVAGADAIVHKGGQTRELFDAIRQTARGDKALPPVSEPLLEAAAQALDPEDLPLLGMLVNLTSPTDIAATMRLERGELDRRVAGMLGRLKVPAPPAEAPRPDDEMGSVPPDRRHANCHGEGMCCVAPPAPLTGLGVIAICPMCSRASDG